MKVYITGTPDIDDSYILDAITILRKVVGPIEFKNLKPLPLGSIIDVLPSLRDYNRRNEVQIEELKSLWGIIRLYHKLPPDSIIVILTSKKFDYNRGNFVNRFKDWVSYSQNNNIAVLTSRWNQIVDHDPILAIVHQIIENVFQLMCGINVDTANIEEFVHFGTKYCINDFCENNKEIAAKLKGAFICPQCTKLAAEKMDSVHYYQIKGLLDEIKNALQIDPFEHIKAKTPLITLKENGSIEVEGRILNFNKSYTLQALLIFFILNNGNEGKILKELNTSECKNKLTAIGRLLGKTSTNLGAFSGNSNFTSYTSRIDGIIAKQFGKALASELRIKSTKVRQDLFEFYFSYPPSHLQIEESFYIKLSQNLEF